MEELFFDCTPSNSTAIQEVDTPHEPRSSEGVLQWKLEERAAKRLDEIARSAGATHFTVRLAAFAALIADVTASSTVVIGTGFANRNQLRHRTSLVRS